MTAETTERPDTPIASSGAAPRWLRGIFIANLVAQIAIVVTGGIVRLTGSGLGCPTWPECVEGSYVPTSRQEEAWHKYVEFGNRLLTFVLAALAIAAIVGAFAWWRRQRRAGAAARGPVLALAAIPIIGTVVQAVLGGVTVLTGLNPWAVSAHFLVSIAIIAGCVLLVVRSGEPGDRPVTRLVRPEVRILGWALVWVMVVTSLVLIPVAPMGLVYTVAAVVLGAVFLLEAHLLRRRALSGITDVRPMRLFHWSITYLALLFLAVAVDPFVTG